MRYPHAIQNIIISSLTAWRQKEVTCYNAINDPKFKKLVFSYNLLIDIYAR